MGEKIKTAVLISGSGTNLQALIDAAAAGALPHAKLCAVISNKREAYGLSRAEQADTHRRTHLPKRVFL